MDLPPLLASVHRGLNLPTKVQTIEVIAKKDKCKYLPPMLVSVHLLDLNLYSIVQKLKS